MYGNFRTFVFGCSAALGALIVGPGAASAQEYPDRFIKLIVPYGAGATDTVARIIAKPASEFLKQPIVIENRPGGGSTVGLIAATKARPDGYTITFCGFACSTAPNLYTPAPFKLEQFTFIATLVEQPLVLLVRKDLDVDGIRALVAKAKSARQELTFGSPGAGSANQLAAELLKSQTGIPLLAIPYQGAGPALIDLIAGRIDIFFGAVGGVLGHIKTGQLKPIAVTGRTRIPQLPNVPTLEESGLTGFDSPKNRLAGPAGMPPEIVEKLNAAFRAALKDPEVMKSMAEMATPTVGDTPAEAAADAKFEYESVSKLIRENGIKIEN